MIDATDDLGAVILLLPSECELANVLACDEIRAGALAHIVIHEEEPSQILQQARLGSLHEQVFQCDQGLQSDTGMRQHARQHSHVGKVGAPLIEDGEVKMTPSILRGASSAEVGEDDGGSDGVEVGELVAYHEGGLPL